MNKDEIRRMANTCENYLSCALCPYNPEDIKRFIGDKWKGGCPNYDRKLVYAMGKGYRKVGEGEQVVNAEQFYETLNAAQECGKRMGYAQGRDETARKILQEIQQMDGFSCDYDIDDIVLKIANKYGIELEE